MAAHPPENKMAAERSDILELGAESENLDTNWKPRCIDYWSKWRACAASSNQFHKYYQFGEFEECAAYQQDLKNCVLWKTKKSMDALESLYSRRQEEIKQNSGKFAHTVWEKRENPAKDWNQD